MMTRTKPLRGTPINRADPLARGLVGYWLLNEGGGDRAWDLSGNGYHATLVNMAPTTDWVSAAEGGALQFPGADDWLSVPSAITIHANSGLSIVCRFRFNAGSSKYQTIWSAERTTIGTDRHSAIRLTAAEVLSYEVGNGVDVAGINGSTLVAGNVYTVALTWDGATLCGYLNGKPDGVPAALTGTLYSDARTKAGFGYRACNSEHPINYTLDYGCVYNRALTAAEIAALYREPWAMFDWPRMGWLYAAGEAGDVQTVARTVALYGLETYTNEHDLALWGAEGKEVTRSLAAWASDPETVGRALALYGWNAEEVSRALALWAADPQTAVRALVLAGVSTEAVTRALGLSGADAQAVARALTLYGTTTEALARAVVLSGADPQTVSLTMELLGADPQTVSRAVGLFGADQQPVSRALGVFGIDSQTVARALILSGADPLVAERTLVLAGADPQTAARVVALWAQDQDTVERVLALYSAEVATVERSMALYGSDLASVARALELWAVLPGDTQEVLRTMVLHASESQITERAAELWGAAASALSRTVAIYAAEALSTSQSLLLWGTSGAGLRYPAQFRSLVYPAGPRLIHAGGS